MNCLPCCNNDDDDEEEASDPQTSKDNNAADLDAAKEAAASNSKAKTYNFRELAMATKNFRQECLLGEGGFGRVFKGKLQSGQVVAVKQLDRNGMQGHKEFLVEVLMLSLIQHPNLVSLIGYCADGDQRLLVYEYLSMGSLENQLFGDDPDKKTMDWVTRMKIASGAANGLEYLHEKANPPIIYRDLKPSNILLDESFEPKLSDFGLAKLGAGAGKVNPTSRVMGTYGYSAPEYSSGGELTLKSDIYSFGVVLLELITGRKAVDTTRPNDEQNLVTWAQPIFREPKRFPELADPRLNNEFPVTSLNQVVGICAMCLQEEPCVRPLIGDVVAALSFLAMPQPMPSPAPAPPPENTHAPPSEQKMHYDIETNQPDKADNDRSSEDSDSSESDILSASNKSHDESSQISGDRDISTQSSARESERQDSDRRQSFDNNSDERSTYSDSDSEGEDTSYDDPETTEIEDPGTSRSETSSANYSLYSAQSTDSSLKSDRGNKSSKHGSSKRSSPTPRARSHRRKPVVTFKEPSLSAKKNGTRKPDEKNLSSQSNNQRVSDSNATEIRQKSSSSSSSSSDSSSEFEIEEGSSRNVEDTKISLKEEDYEEDTDSTDRIDETHRDFDQSHEDVPKL